ncbi:TPA: hypothetical protein N0F65_002823 [Lagenidium giganteum]|uniref:Retrovirus-related Pol polyprotein from transposon TNT 1-94-like beta-barrel domain-containing protein n=1 Tax=Lagenidium giganteum TaxID=4803 RepID=A0AAV2ZBS4_9STRA|nr:TPA: hypothetical protein N0F65_002823 [Lagenidium giganteum]
MRPRFEDLATYSKLSKDIDVVIADGTAMKAVGICGIVITCPNGKHITVTNSLHIPKLDKRLMSVSKLTQKGLTVQSNNEHCAILRNNEMVLMILDTRTSTDWRSNLNRQQHTSLSMKSVMTGTCGMLEWVTPMQTTTSVVRRSLKDFRW